MEIQELPEKFQELWQKCKPLLKKGRNDDFEHAIEMAKLILNYEGELEVDLDILIPLAFLHDIGHSFLLDEHFKYITGAEKVTNGKLVHMLVGAKIAKEILESINYDKEKRAEIVDIISIHDFDQLDVEDFSIYYDTHNKKLFHDFDSSDRYTEKRINNSLSRFHGKADKLLVLLEKFLENFFFEEFKIKAEKNLKRLKNNKW